MPKHLTVRMAWHDNNWNGKVCRDPQTNKYCTGSHSLLSERIARNKRPDIEEKYVCNRIDMLPNNYLPPCFWSTNAFSTANLAVRHDHPFKNLRVKAIEDNLPAFSMFTWPFRLSFNHDKSKKDAHGNYPPKKELEGKIDHFRTKFKPGKSFVFFYLNYDNPVSAEESTYALVGCSLLRNDIPRPRDFQFDSDELSKIRKSHDLKNFPEMNWAMLVSYDPENTIILPYKEYLDKIDENPDDESWREKLDEMKVLIEEEALIPSFKYVANEIDDDGCIYLLYKLKKAILLVQEHGIKDFSKEAELIDKFLACAWGQRGLYPSLGNILDAIGGFDPELKVQSQLENKRIGSQIVDKIQENVRDQDLLDATFHMLTSDSPIPDYLAELSSYIQTLRSNIRDWEDHIELLKKLSLFSLTPYQINRIVWQKDEPFSRSIDSEEIVGNPYLLAEEYRDEWDESYLDLPDMPDSPIGLFKIDIGMFPDPSYLKSNPKLQNLSPASPKRLRSIIMDFLRSLESNGDCYATSKTIYRHIIENPVFYRKELNIKQAQLEAEQGKYHQHFKEKLKMVKSGGDVFFYLNEVKLAEEIVKKTVTELLDRKDYKVEIAGLDKFIQQECVKVRDYLGENFDEQAQKLFLEERGKLFNAVLKKPFYVITGKPGSGKTKILAKIVKEMSANRESVVLLAPTGKATLRLQAEIKKEKLDIEAQTIDRYIYGKGYGKYLEDFAKLPKILEEDGQIIDNLIVDECSMVDLKRFAVLFGMLKRDNKEDGKLKVRRIILVGDENQLPPIGFGKVFFEIIEYLKNNQRYESNYVYLRSNCRQGFDPKILEIADLFRSRNRYYEETFERLHKGGAISQGFEVVLWEDPKKLLGLVEEKLDQVLENELTKEQLIKNREKGKRLCVLFGLYPTGHVPENSPENLKLDNLQILSPYRGGNYGTIGLNEHVKEKYKVENWMDPVRFSTSPFDHSDKIIRINNWYAYDPTINGRTLVLSNGSIGVVCNKSKPKIHRKYYFIDQERPFNKIDDEENFELAYAITVHKSQGSDFNHVFLIMPKRSGLLNKELVYTALTRSKGKVTLFLQQDGGKNPLEIARHRSAILERCTSIFTVPEDLKAKYWPEKGIHVDSKSEYILYSALDKAQKSGKLKFKPHEGLNLTHKSLVIHPDFTIWVNNRTYYWEHLGMLDIQEYSKDWEERRKEYEKSGLLDFLVTTDDLGGIRGEIIEEIIEDMTSDKLKNTPDSRFSKHHYQLYY